MLMRFWSTRSWLCCLLPLLTCLTVPATAADEPTYLLAVELAEGDTSTVEVAVEAGGDIVYYDSAEDPKYPFSTTAELDYTEQIITWSANSKQPARSIREYQQATVKIQKDDGGVQRELPKAKCTILVELRDGQAVFAGAETPLTRDQYDLVNAVGNTLAINRLLPGRALAEGESWEHDAETISALLDMDNVAVCEVRSVVTGCTHHQVQIRLAGTVHGTIDGAPTEMELRGAYLFHEQHKRITKFNLAIKEKRTASQLVPGLDVVAKVSVIVTPTTEEPITEETDEQKDSVFTESQPLVSTLRYESPQQGFQFLHDRAWYVTGEQSNLVSLGLLRDGNINAFCNVTTLPARSQGRETTLEEFESDVRKTIGESLESVRAATRWTSSQGHECYGVIATAKVEDVLIEWRYYLIASPDLPRVSLSVSIEQSQIEAFKDADKQIVDSIELLGKSTVDIVAKPSKQLSR